MEIKINLHVSADASITSALMAFAAAMAGQATTVAPMKAVMPPVNAPVPVEPPQPKQQEEPSTVQAEAEPQTEITPDDVFGMNEAELSKCPSGLLYDAIRERTDINPDDLPGKNTNAKLRRILLDYVESSTGEEQAPEDYHNPEVSQGTTQAVPTREEFRAVMIPRIQAKDPSIKMAAIKAVKASGYDSIEKIGRAHV